MLNVIKTTTSAIILCLAAIMILLTTIPSAAQATAGQSGTGQQDGEAATRPALDAGASHSLYLRSDGTVVAWGNNDNGQLNTPSGLSGVKAISAGQNHSLALKSDGTVAAWGQN